MRILKSTNLMLVGIFVLFVVGILVSSSYAGIDPEAIVGIWLLDEGEDNLVKDSSGNDHNGEILGNVSWTEGKFGQALEFPGAAGSYVNIPHEDSLSITTYTITAWIKMKDVQRSEQHLVVKEEPNQVRNYGIAIQPPAGNHAAKTIFTQGAGNWIGADGQTPMTDDSWHHVAGAYDLQTIYIYVDGVLESQSGFTLEPDTTPGPLTIGAGGATGSIAPSEGVIDEVGLFNEALDVDAISSIMTEGLAEVTGVSVVSSAGKLTTIWGKLKAEN